MSVSHAKSHLEPQRAARNWIAETLIVAGILAFGYFALMVETQRQQAFAPAGPTVPGPLELLR